LFFTAETLGKTVDELLLGEVRPMSSTELRYWAAYFIFKNKLQEESYEKLRQESQESEEERPTLGRRSY
jgi:hypothetical protein